jgi:D-arginine dehydrogenase
MSGTADAETYDFAVIGAGIAGASVAAHLAETRRVVVLEQESAPGRHATGRSAAIFSEIYGPPPVRALSRASRAFFEAPPAEFCAAPLMRRRGVMWIARADQIDRLKDHAANPDVAAQAHWMTADDAVALNPILRRDYLAIALYEPEAQDLDVDALHQGYLRRFRAWGGALRLDAQATDFSSSPEGWRITLANGETVAAKVLINAAGAWADEIAVKAGRHPVGLTPARRTAVLVDPPAGLDPSPWPMVVDTDEEFYWKPDAGRLFLSPADETPSPPCDAYPDEMDIAIAVDRVEQASTLEVKRIFAKWAGLRTFVPDRAPVVGFDTAERDFFWLAGQGGYGIQTAPALARVAAALAQGDAPPQDVLNAGLDIDAISPSRPSLNP